jgi:hypothetical protein
MERLWQFRGFHRSDGPEGSMQANPPLWTRWRTRRQHVSGALSSAMPPPTPPARRWTPPADWRPGPPAHVLELDCLL